MKISTRTRENVVVMTTVIIYKLCSSKMDYKIHFKNLEEDFYKKIIQEDIRKKQEDVKMRVLGDPRITYEQYSEMLQGAHLKPIKKGDHADISQGYKRKVTLKDCETE